MWHPFRQRQPDYALIEKLERRLQAVEDELERVTLRWGELADITRRAQARWEQRERRAEKVETISRKAEIRRRLQARGHDGVR